MQEQARYQRGSLRLEKRRSQPDVWTFRYYVEGPDGTRTYPKQVIGSVTMYPKRKDAEKAVIQLRVNINEGAKFTPCTVVELVAHYREHEFPRLAFSTSEGYVCYLDRYVLPKYGSRQLSSLTPVEVEEWLDKLTLKKKQPWRKGVKQTPPVEGKQSDSGKAAAPGTRSKIRNLMSAIFSHAIRNKWLAINPITEVRASAKRRRVPDLLSGNEFPAVLAELGLRERAAVLMDGTTGLRRSELFALRWSYFDFANLQASVQHSIYRNRPGNCKTEASRKPVPLHPLAVEVLKAWREVSAYDGDDDFVFPSLRLKGKAPFSPDAMLNDYLRPAIARAGITGKVIGWHSFRHGLAENCRQNGVDLKVTQELMRHANSRITLEIYQQAVSQEKREAQNLAVEGLLGATKKGA